MNNNEELLVDALPYFDTGYDEPGVKQAALSLIEDECRRYRPTKNYLEMLGPISINQFETEIMRNEFARLEQNIPMEMLSMKRYELPPPPTGKQTEVSAWQESVDNSYAQLEHQFVRIMNLEPMSEYGTNAWKEHIKVLEKLFEETEKQLIKIQNQVVSVNLQRKTEQTEAGEKLRSLEQNWVGLVSKNYEIECATIQLEKELNRLRQENEQQQQTQEESSEEQLMNVETLQAEETMQI